MISRKLPKLLSCLLHMKGVIDRLKLPVKVIHIAQILNGGPL